MKLVELAAALIVLALAAVGLTEAVAFPRASKYLPTAVLGFAAVLSLAWAAQSVLALRRQPPRLTLDRAATRRLVTLAGFSVAYAVAMQWIGFFTSTLLFLPGAAAALGYRDRRGLFLGTGAFLLLLYAVFGMLLRTPLPPELILEALEGRT